MKSLIAALETPIPMAWDRYGSFGATARLILAGLVVSLPATCLAVIIAEPGPFNLWIDGAFFLKASLISSAPPALLLRWLLRPIGQAEGGAEN